MSDVEQSERKKRWSYSRTTSFDHCKYEFYLDYVINDDDQYLSEGNFYAEEIFRRFICFFNLNHLDYIFKPFYRFLIFTLDERYRCELTAIFEVIPSNFLWKLPILLVYCVAVYQK